MKQIALTFLLLSSALTPMAFAQDYSPWVVRCTAQGPSGEQMRLSLQTGVETRLVESLIVFVNGKLVLNLSQNSRREHVLSENTPPLLRKQFRMDAFDNLNELDERIVVVRVSDTTPNAEEVVLELRYVASPANSLNRFSISKKLLESTHEVPFTNLSCGSL